MEGVLIYILMKMKQTKHKQDFIEVQGWNLKSSNRVTSNKSGRKIVMELG